MRISSAAIVAAGLILGSLHILTSIGNPVGTIEDDSVQVLLARSLSHGAFALPDAAGVPITDPLPGLAALLLIPVRLVEPHWGVLRLLFLAAAAISVYLTWRLAAQLLSKEAAAASAFLFAATPALINHSGLVIPDIPLLALSLFLVSALPRASVPLLAGGAALAALLRPQGALFALCLGASFIPKSPKKAAGFLAAAFLPLAAWTIRNHLAAGTVTGYVLNWRSQAALLADPALAAAHAQGILTSFLSEGLLGLVEGPFWMRAAVSLLVLGLAAAGAVRILRTKSQPQAFVASAYCILVLALHMTWVPVQARYLIPLAPFLWIFLCADFRRLPLALAALLMLRFDAGLAWAGIHRKASFEPETMAWIRENTPPQARLQAFKFNGVTLLSGRKTWLPPLESRGGPEWLDRSLDAGLDYVLVESAFNPGGFLPPNVRYVGMNLGNWARSAPGAAALYRNDAEGTVVFKLSRIPSKNHGNRPASRL